VVLSVCLRTEVRSGITGFRIKLVKLFAKFGDGLPDLAHGARTVSSCRCGGHNADSVIKMGNVPVRHDGDKNVYPLHPIRA
jgi:hypothetical protein